MKTIKDRLQAIRDTADAQVELLCAEIREEHVIPFCDKHGLWFRAGMGNWGFDRVEGMDVWLDEETPMAGEFDDNNMKCLEGGAALLELFQLEDPTSENNLGPMLNDYKPANWDSPPALKFGQCGDCNCYGKVPSKIFQRSQFHNEYR